MHVVMVHGFADTGRLFRVLRRELEKEGHFGHAPTLHPRDGRLGLPDLAAKLDLFIRENVPAGSRMALVGFSMGALVARHYLQAAGRGHSCDAYFSLAGPQMGTISAYLYPGLGTRQMRPGSVFLSELNSGLPALGAMPLYTYRTPLDIMVFPPATTRISGATETVVWCPLHAMLAGDSHVIAHVIRELGNLETTSSPNLGRLNQAI
ncbi:MAG TPA: alpha/beta fold hydrolase [Opitutaceae bacterium]